MMGDRFYPDNFNYPNQVFGYCSSTLKIASLKLYICRINEVIVAKRRNLKKEKAERNKAYARKFRKRTTGRRGRRGGYNRSYGNQNNEDNKNENSQETANAAD